MLLKQYYQMCTEIVGKRSSAAPAMHIYKTNWISMDMGKVAENNHIMHCKALLSLK